MTADGHAITAHRGLYAYAVVTAAGRPLDLTGIDGRSTIRVHNHEGLGLALSDVDVSLFDDIGGDLTETGRLATLVRCHEEVLCALLARGPVLPMRFGTVLSAGTDVDELLKPRQQELATSLERVHDHREWRLRIMSASRVGTDKQETDLDPTAGAGTAYLTRRRGELVQAAARREHVRAALDQANTDLGRLAVEACRLPGRTGTVTFAYLVPRSGQKHFVEQAHRAVGELDRVRCAAELSGPWPAYSFAGVALNGQADD